MRAQKKEIKYLTQKNKTLSEEKDQLIDSFQTSSQVLLERIKDLEAQLNPMAGGDRPETANVLGKICKQFVEITLSTEAEKEGRRIGSLKPQQQAVEESKGTPPR